jgi:hypothetical protein
MERENLRPEPDDRLHLFDLIDRYRHNEFGIFRIGSTLNAIEHLIKQGLGIGKAHMQELRNADHDEASHSRRKDVFRDVDA